MSLLLIPPLLVFAQTTGTIEGTVTDQSGAPLPGVTVEITSPNLQGTRTAVTAADGRYRFPSVPPGAYSVTGSLSGFGKVQKKATVTLDATTTVLMSLALSTTAEVTVTGEAPLVDTTSTTTGSNYSAAVISKLPVGRNYADVVFSQPGVQADFGETQGRSMGISIYGSTSSENLFLIDGVNTTNVIKGIQGKDINNEFVQEVEVKTGGYQAEYGRNTGGVVNVITKSGGNEFHGGVFGYYNDTGMRSDIKDVTDTAPYSEQGDALASNAVLSKDVRQEYGFDLGGFAVRDVVWFFGAYDRVQVNQDTQPQDPGNPQYLVNSPISFVQNKYSGKLTFNLFQGTSIVGSVFSDSQSQEGALVVPTSVSPYTFNGRRDVGGPDYGARLNQLFGSTGIFTFQYAKHADRFVTNPDGPSYPQFRDYTAPAGALPYSLPGVVHLQAGDTYNGFGSVFGPVNNNQSNRSSYVGMFTAYLGNHEIKIGGDYQQDRTFGSTYYTGGQRARVRPCTQTGSSVCDLSLAPFYTNANGVTQQVFFQHDLFGSGTEDDFQVAYNLPYDVPTKRWSGFLQDQWRVVPSLTLNFGVRYDSENYYGQCPVGLPCGNPQVAGGENFKAFSLTNQWSPRVGFTWDWAGDGTSKLYGSWGYFYYAIPTDLNVRTYTANSQVITYNYDPYSLNQDPNAPRHNLFQGGAVDGEPADQGMKAAYQQEFTIGAEKAFDPTLSVGVKGTYRALMRTVEDRCDLDSAVYAASCALYNPGGTGPAATGQYGLCDGSQNPTDPNAGACGLTGIPVRAAKRYFRGIELTARKQFSTRIWAQASFLYSSLIGNYSGAIREASGQTDPGINADFDYYQFTDNGYNNLDLDRPIQARLDAVYNAPFGLSAGLGFYVRSGVPLSQQGFFNNFYPDLLFLTERGTVGRTPTDYELNLSLGYNWNIGPVTITPMLYVYNLLNRQTSTTTDQVFNPNGSFVTTAGSPYYGQGGVEAGQSSPQTPDIICSGPAPCADNPDYQKIASRTGPRLLRAALKITF